MKKLTALFYLPNAIASIINGVAVSFTNSIIAFHQALSVPHSFNKPAQLFMRLNLISNTKNQYKIVVFIEPDSGCSTYYLFNLM